METTNKNTNKANTPAPGAGVTAENPAQTMAAAGASQSTDLGDNKPEADKGEKATEDQPAWVTDVLASNELVIESNQSVIEAIGQFNEKAGGLVKDIMDTAKNGGENGGSSVKPRVELEIDPEAKYVVAKGKRFQDKFDPAKMYTESMNVSKLDPERLKNLLNQGIIEEA